MPDINKLITKAGRNAYLHLSILILFRACLDSLTKLINPVMGLEQIYQFELKSNQTRRRCTQNKLTCLGLHGDLCVKVNIILIGKTIEIIF